MNRIIEDIEKEFEELEIVDDIVRVEGEENIPEGPRGHRISVTYEAADTTSVDLAREASYSGASQIIEDERINEEENEIIVLSFDEEEKERFNFCILEIPYKLG